MANDSLGSPPGVLADLFDLDTDAFAADGSTFDVLDGLIPVAYATAAVTSDGSIVFTGVAEGLGVFGYNSAPHPASPPAHPPPCTSRSSPHPPRPPPHRHTTTTTSTTTTSTTTSTTTTTTTTEAPVPPQGASQTVADSGVIVGSLIDDGDTLGTPAATITSVVAVQGPGSLSFGVPTAVDDVNGRPCGTITVASDGSYSFTPALPGPRECTIEYTLSNAGGGSTASETFQVPAPQ